MASYKYFPSVDDLYNAQYDILFESLKDNPLLPQNAVPVLNKALLTKNKQLIKAVNEILESVSVVDGKMRTLMETYNGFVGNPNVDTEEIAELTKYESDLLKAIVKIAKEINGEDLSSPIDISHIGKSLKESINKINNRLIDVESGLDNKITYLESCLFKSNWKLNGDYYEYSYYSELIPDNTIINITPNIQSKEDEYALCYAGLLPNISTGKDETGKPCYIFKARNIPSKDINIFIYLMKNIKEQTTSI